MIKLQANTAGYGGALRAMLLKLAAEFSKFPATALPISMYIAGGAALFLHVGERATEDVDAAFSRRILLEGPFNASYQDEYGQTRLVYLDRNYNDTLSLMHEDAQQDSIPVMVDGVDGKVLDVRVLTPTDLAVSKLSRFSEQDRDDIIQLAKRKLITSTAVKQRAQEALGGYVGNMEMVQHTVEIAGRLIQRHA